MTNEQIKDLALKCGFTLRDVDGQQDLKPYVYDFARKLLADLQTEIDSKEEYIYSD